MFLARARPLSPKNGDPAYGQGLRQQPAEDRRCAPGATGHCACGSLTLAVIPPQRPTHRHSCQGLWFRRSVSTGGSQKRGERPAPQVRVPGCERKGEAATSPAAWAGSTCDTKNKAPNRIKAWAGPRGCAVSGTAGDSSSSLSTGAARRDRDARLCETLTTQAALFLRNFIWV